MPKIFFNYILSAGGCVEVSEVRSEPPAPTVPKEEQEEDGDKTEDSMEDDSEHNGGDEDLAGRDGGDTSCLSAMDLCVMSMDEEKEESNDEEEYSDCDPNQFCEISMDSKLEVRKLLKA